MSRDSSYFFARSEGWRRFWASSWTCLKKALRTTGAASSRTARAWGGSRSSSRALGFLSGGSLLQLVLHRSNHLLGRVERAEGATFLEIFVGLGEAGVDDTALLRGVLVIGSRKFRTVNHELRREHNFATLKAGLDEIAHGDAGLAA